MPDTNARAGRDWNVLTSPWLGVMTPRAELDTCSPLEALRRGKHIQCIATASPLDQFAALRFLLTLLYWKANTAGGVALLPRASVAVNANDWVVPACAAAGVQVTVCPVKVMPAGAGGLERAYVTASPLGAFVVNAVYV